MITYAKFKKLNIDTSSVGWEQTEREAAYFCTPRGAKIIGRAGVDGIHYCTVRGLGSTVFSVSPMNTPGHYVHPIAENFEDLLRLLLSCLDMNIIEQAWMWDREQLDEQIAELRQSEYFDETPLRLIREKCGLTPMENPFRYLVSLQQSFDYGSIPFTKEYYETVDDSEWQPPAWKVTYEGDFFPERGKGGSETVLNGSFVWNKRKWFVPSVYLCARNVVVADIFAEIPPEEFLQFKEDVLSGAGAARLTEEDEEKFRRLNPVNVDFHPTLTVNGAELPNKRGRGETWFPASCRDSGAEEDVRAKYIAEHYGLDLSRIWVMRRCAFLSETGIETITSLRLKMEGDAEFYPGMHFTAPAVGDSFSFPHPVRGTEHTLTVTEYAQQELNSAGLDNEEFTYPTRMTVMRYTVSPDLPREEFSVRDCAHGDSPRRKETAPAPKWDFSSSIAVIRSSDGPTAVIIGDTQSAGMHSACSALYFEKRERVEWRMSFRVKTVEDAEFDLL